MEMAPEGVFNRAARGGEYPKCVIKVAEYVVTTPLDIEIYQYHMSAVALVILLQGVTIRQIHVPELSQGLEDISGDP